MFKDITALRILHSPYMGSKLQSKTINRKASQSCEAYRYGVLERMEVALEFKHISFVNFIFTVATPISNACDLNIEAG